MRVSNSLPLDGAVAILRERVRQITHEGYQPEHDLAHTGNELAWAAWCLIDRALSDHPDNPSVPDMWPWEPAAWKPGDPIRMLVKAGALAAAEIDRRLAER
jgi:hypothetical protein